MTMEHRKIALICVSLALFCGSLVLSNACDELQSFEGFGIYLGSLGNFAISSTTVLPQVVDKIYNDLGIRHFRTSYESSFSPSRDIYKIVCSPDATPTICSWIDIHNEISKYPNISVIASIWSPPSYMKDIPSDTLHVSEEINFHYFIRNITALIKDQFNITIERVSPINEPENIFSAWEHTNMLPQQLCRMVVDFNDSLISACPENSYFPVSVLFENNQKCLQSCKIFCTHAYTLNIVGNNRFKVYYDLLSYARTIPSHIPIWQTEVSSTFDNAVDNQMRECLDMAINIVNFVGHTCIQRYYYWYSYTLNPSGESMIWGDINGSLTFPKKYFGYKHFTRAAYGGSKIVQKYDPVNGISYLTFGDSKAVFVNNLSSTVAVNWKEAVSCLSGTFCCTTEIDDWNCSGNGTILPDESVCSCDFGNGEDEDGLDNKFHLFFFMIIVMCLLVHGYFRKIK